MNNPEKLATYGTHNEEKQKQKHNTICAGHHDAQTNTNSVNKTWTLLQTTGGKDEPNIVFISFRELIEAPFIHNTINSYITKTTFKGTW